MGPRLDLDEVWALATAATRDKLAADGGPAKPLPEGRPFARPSTRPARTRSPGSRTRRSPKPRWPRAQIIEHYEIAGYGTAAAHAKQLGKQEDLQLLLRSLEEEKRTDELLTQLAKGSVNQKAAE